MKSIVFRINNVQASNDNQDNYFLGSSGDSVGVVQNVEYMQAHYLSSKLSSILYEKEDLFGDLLPNWKLNIVLRKV